MMLASRHLNDLKAPLAVLLVVALAGAGLLAWTRSLIARDQQSLLAQENQLRDARTRFQRSGDERDLIARYMAPFQELRGRGLIGPESRINWLDALRLANQQARLYGAEYQVGTQQPYAYAQEFNAARLGMAQSLMKLTLQLAHEGELMRFFSLLETQNAGTFDINQCVLDRTIVPGAVASPQQPNLRAECELAWITINPEPSERKP